MEFNELIKNFERIRTYMKDFFVYGFRSRNDFTQKSARTYDNERRRIEGYLKNYIQYQNNSKGKSVFISANSNSIFENPLYPAWKSKSFTDNDILLHFYILNLLQGGQSMSADELSDTISAQFNITIDSQVIRLKLKEYETEEILCSTKKGKKSCYHLNSLLSIEQLPLYNILIESITFFQESAPFGVIGSTILDREKAKNKFFSFKHQFLMHTLDDEILLDILTAMKEHRAISFTHKSHRRQSESKISGIPLKVLVSTQTGRRYLCLYYSRTRRYSSVRLDSISQVLIQNSVENFNLLTANLASHLPKCWGVSFGGENRIESIQFTLFIDVEKEPYILQRLEREKRGGKITQTGKHRYQYSGLFYDINEALPWVKTFIGRIITISGSNQYAIDKLQRDLIQMHRMYFDDEKEAASGTL